MNDRLKHISEHEKIASVSFEYQKNGGICRIVSENGDEFESFSRPFDPEECLNKAYDYFLADLKQDRGD